MLKFIRWPGCVSILALGLLLCTSGCLDWDEETLDDLNSGINPSYTISGSIGYQRILTYSNITADSVDSGSGRLDFAHPVERPCRFVRVQAISAGGQVVAETHTDGNGNYRLLVPSGINQARVRVLSEVVPLPGQTGGVRVQDNVQGKIVYVSDSALLDPFLGKQVDMLLPSGYDAQGNQISVRSAAPFAVADSLVEGYQFWMAGGIDFTQGPVCTVNWSEKNRPSEGSPETGAIGGSHLSGSELFILGDKNSDTDEYDWHVVLHEFGHWVQKFYFRSDTPAGDHSRGDVKDPRLAFDEALGSAISGIILKDPLYKDTAVGSGSASSLERNRSNLDPSPGWYSEATVEVIIYDLFDPIGLEIGSGFQDNLQLPTTALVAAMTFQKNSQAFNTIFSFLNGIVEAGTDAADLTPLLNFESSDNEFGITSTDQYAAGETHDGGVAGCLPLYRDVSATATDGGPGGIVAVALGEQPEAVYNWLSGVRFWFFIGDGQKLEITVKNSASVKGNVSLQVYTLTRRLFESLPEAPHQDVNWSVDATISGQLYLIVLNNEGEPATEVDVEFSHT